MRSGGDRGDRKASGPTPIVCRALMAAGTPLFSTDASLANETKSAMTFSRWHARFFASMECRRGHAGRGYPADRVSPGPSMLTLRVSMAPVPIPGAKLFRSREVESAHRLADSADLGSSGSGLLNLPASVTAGVVARRAVNLYFSLPDARSVPLKSWSRTSWFGQWSPEPSKRTPVHRAPSLIATRFHALSDAFH